MFNDLSTSSVSIRIVDNRSSPGSQLLEVDFNNEKSVLAMDPITWSAVGIWIVQGLITAAAGWAMKKLLDSLAGEDPQIFFERLIEAFSGRVRQVILEEKMRDVLARVEGLTVNYQEYINARRSSRDRLELATSESSYLVSIIKGLGLAGTTAFMVAAGLRLGVLRERVVLLKEDRKSPAGEYRNIADRAGEYIQHARFLVKQLTDLQVSRVGPAVPDSHYCLLHNEIGAQPHGMFCYVLDGSIRKCFCRVQNGEAQRNAAIESERARLVDDFNKEIGLFIYAIISEWEKIKKDAEENAKK